VTIMEAHQMLLPAMSREYRPLRWLWRGVRRACKSMGMGYDLQSKRRGVEQGAAYESKNYIFCQTPPISDG
jgi:hypothetical protein